jgi:uncharacterized protein (DUF58 family)
VGQTFLSAFVFSSFALGYAVFRLLQYYGQWQGFRGRMTQLPAWARLLITLVALPGIVLIALSILAFLVSLLALLLLTVPLYRFLTALCGVKPGEVVPAGTGGFGPLPDGMEAVIDQDGEGSSPSSPEVSVVESPQESEPRRARRQIDVKIVE